MRCAPPLPLRYLQLFYPRQDVHCFRMVRRFVISKSRRNPALCYVVAVLSIVLGTLLRFPLQQILGQSVPFLLYHPAVLFSAWYGGWRPGILATVLGAIASSFFWMEPEFGFAPLTPRTTVQLGLFVIVSSFMTWLMDLLHRAIDDLHRMDAQVRDQARRLEQVLASMTDGFMIFDRDWRFIYVNDSGARLARKPKEELIGRNVWELFQDEVGQPGYQQLTRAMRERVPVHFEYLYPRFQRWFEYKAYPAEEGLALYVSDITEHKNVQLAVTNELEQRVAQKTAELQSRNQSLEALTHSLAHDLRAPMRTIGGFASILLEDHGHALPLEGQQLANRIVSSAKHAEKLMADLLEFSRLSHVDLQVVPVDCQAVAESAVNGLSAEIAAQSGTVQIQTPLPKVLANTVIVEQALSNLILNALKYSTDGQAPEISIFAESHSPFARIVVQDNGIGIAPEDIPKLFKPFHRLSHAKPGSGLGLSIVAKGIERVGGRVGVQSQPGRGSRFWFELPAGQ